MRAASITVLLILTLISTTNAQIGFSKFSIGYSNWTRSYGGFNEAIFFSTTYRPVENFVKKSWMPTVSAEISLLKDFTSFKTDWIGLEGRLGQAKFEFVNDIDFDGTRVVETISQRVVPATVNLVYHAEVAPWFSIYGGTGMNSYLIQETAGRSVSAGEGAVEPRESSGNVFGWTYHGGIEIWIVPNFGLGLETRQNFGSYTKSKFALDGTKEKISVDLKGIEVGFSLRYRLNAPKASSEKAE
ncbi:MAG: outer membrane beta-barrel protein [Cyclobacteriaceae bacterium]